MIIFGWGHQKTKNFGPTFRQSCSHCNNEDYWILTRIMTWFTLFFIPVFPYSIKYFLSCPICKYGLKLNSGQTEQIKPIAEANQLLLDGYITKEEYQVRLNQLGDGSPERVEAEVVEPEVLNSDKVKLKFCVACGHKVTKEVKFCGNCGTETTLK